MATRKDNPETENKKDTDVVNIAFKTDTRHSDKLKDCGYRSAHQACQVAARCWPDIYHDAIKQMKARFDDDQLELLASLSLPEDCAKNQLIAMAETREFPMLIMNRLNTLSEAHACVLADLIQRKVELIKVL